MTERGELNRTTWCWEISQGEGRISLQPVLLPDHCQGLDAISNCLPSGSYTTFRTYRFTYALLLGDHLRRLESSAMLSGKDISLDDGALRQGLRLAIAEIARLEGRPIELRLRLTLDLEEQPGRVIISAEALHTPGEAVYVAGVRVVTSRVHRHLPAAKLTGFIKTASEERQTLPADAFEAIMIDEEGRLKEGLSSNFFAVRQGSLWTAGEGVLPGVTRSLVLESARRLGIETRLEAVGLGQVTDIQEAFITSSSRGVVPVVKIDDALVGEGEPGKITRLIAADFQRLIDEKLEPI